MLSELKRYVIIVLYLWVLFALFSAYKRLLLHENGISVWNESFAIVNALIFGKVILIAQALRLGGNLETARSSGPCSGSLSCSPPS